MNTRTFSATATDLIGNLSRGAHRAIGVYREGGERLGDALEQRWKAALKKTSPKLKPETRKNAARAQRAFSRCYVKGVAVSADGAEVVIDTLAGAATAAVQRVAAFRQAD
jgi:phosphomannomutase